MKTISIIVAEKVLKNIFIEVIDEINKDFTYNYEIHEEYSENNQSSIAIILDIESFKNISNPELINNQLFIIKDGYPISFNQNINPVLIDRPFKIFDLFSTVESNLIQTNKLDQKKIKFKSHIFDPQTRIIKKDKKSVRLTEKESEIFIALVKSKNMYLSKKFLLHKVWQYSNEVDTHTLETHLYSLRKKIDKSLGTKNLIIYEEKKGYLINKNLL